MYVCCDVAAARLYGSTCGTFVVLLLAACGELASRQSQSLWGLPLTVLIEWSRKATQSQEKGCRKLENFVGTIKISSQHFGVLLACGLCSQHRSIAATTLVVHDMSCSKNKGNRERRLIIALVLS